MSATLNFALPADMRAWIDQRLVRAQYNHTSEFPCGAIRSARFTSGCAR